MALYLIDIPFKVLIGPAIVSVNILILLLHSGCGIQYVKPPHSFDLSDNAFVRGDEDGQNKIVK